MKGWNNNSHDGLVDKYPSYKRIVVDITSTIVKVLSTTTQITLYHSDSLSTGNPVVWWQESHREVMSWWSLNLSMCLLFYGRHPVLLVPLLDPTRWLDIWNHGFILLYTHLRELSGVPDNVVRQFSLQFSACRLRLHLKVPRLVFC